MKSLAYRFGLRRHNGFARKFLAGEHVAEAVAAVHRLRGAGLTTTLDYLGPITPSIAEADAATRKLIGIIQEFGTADSDRHVALKLTQFGLRVDRATCVDNLRRLLDPAAAAGFFIRIDMEDSRYTQVTLDVFETLWQQGYRNAGIVVQAYLPRSLADAKRLIALGARVRLVKGGYSEARHVAYRSRAQISRAFTGLMELLLSEGVEPAVATHDPELIAATRRFARGRGISADRFEFQMRYGVRRDLQSALAAAGHRVRVDVPFGSEWFSYLMGHLGEHPSELGFVVRNLLLHR